MWNVQDLDSRLTINRGRLYSTASSVAWDRTSLLLETPFARHKGRYVEFSVTPDASPVRGEFGWQNSGSAFQAYTECAVGFGPNGTLLVFDGGTGTIDTGYPYAANTTYVIRVYDGGPVSLTAGGGGDFFCYVRPGTQASFDFLWRKPAGTAPLTVLYVGFNNASLSGYVDWVRIRNAAVQLAWGYVALPVSGQSMCVAADGLLAVLVEAPATGTMTVTFRGDGGTNFWSLVMDVDRQALDLIKTVSGVSTRVMSMAIPFRPLKLYELKVFTFGSVIRTFSGRVPGPYTTDSFGAGNLVGGIVGAANCFNFRDDAGGNLLW